MRDIVFSALRLYGRHIPALAALFLAGWVANYLLIRFAGFVANIDPVYGQLVLPLAVLARIASYVAMFLVLRPGRNLGQALASSILPFLVVFATWGLIHDDWVAFSIAQLEQRKFDGTDPELFIGVTPITVGIVIVAFVLRLLAKRYSSRLPSWSSYPAAYLEAVWIFIAIDIIGQLSGAVSAWVADRRVVVWGAGIVDAAREALAPLRWITDAAVWLIGEAGTLLGEPLAWLTLAGIVYAIALPARAPKARTAVATERLARVPPLIRKRLIELGSDLVGRWRPISKAARLLWRAGVVTLTLFVLSYAVLDTSSEWLQWAAQRILGPHELSWWFATDTPISLVINLLVEPLRIALISAAWVFCLSRSESGRGELELEEERVGQQSEHAEA